MGRRETTLTLQLSRQLSNAGLAVTIDVGDALDIHPRNKRDVGHRLALSVLGQVYGQKVVCSGPLYEDMDVEGNAIRLRFAHVHGGLMVGAKKGMIPVAAVPGGVLRQFAIAGADRRFFWADARIDGKMIIVSSPQVAAPTAVRYAWAYNPEGCNLYNKEGLPASPFRTDDW